MWWRTGKPRCDEEQENQEGQRFRSQGNRILRRWKWLTVRMLPRSQKKDDTWKHEWNCSSERSLVSSVRAFPDLLMGQEPDVSGLRRKECEEGRRWTQTVLSQSFACVCIKSLQMLLSSDLHFSLVEIYPKEIIRDSDKDLDLTAIIAALFIVEKHWQQHK